MFNESNQQKIPTERWEHFVRKLRDHISQSTESHLTARCWKKSSLVKKISAVIFEEGEILRSTFPSAKNVLPHLENLGWIRRIKVDQKQGEEIERGELEFYFVDMEAAPLAEPTSRELLQASQPDGVICFLDAINFHSLTSQRVTHHHISKLISDPSSKEGGESRRVEGEVKNQNSRKLPNPLGSYLFSFKNEDYFFTRRLRRKVPGVLTKIMGPRTQLRVTTLEQTLLDTLSHPLPCGGMQIIFEAWEGGFSNLSQIQLSTYLTQITDVDLIRRAGALFEIFEETVEAIELQELFLKTKEEVKSLPEIPLIHGIPSSSKNKNWGVSLP